MNYMNRYKEIKIIFENKDMVVLNKPSGVLIHATHNKENDTLADWVLENFSECKNIGEEGRGGIVHRLDRGTSGLVVIARNIETYKELKDLFKNRKIKKKYYALVWGCPKEKSGIINKEIAALNGKRRTIEVWSQKKSSKARDALTRWKVVDSSEEFALLDVDPETGRMHQIRVHLSSIGHPIVCDNLYSGKKKCPEQLNRLFLHSYKLSIPYKEGEKIDIEVPIEYELKEFLDIISLKI